MVDEPQFRETVERNIKRGTALCVRATPDVPGSALAGGLLMSVHPPLYEISWLAVGGAWRGQGIGGLHLRRRRQGPSSGRTGSSTRPARLPIRSG
ncbi:hypothetical protein [Streptomyces sp. AC627_RSS907]|uniref:hypothetical protein n=1 Tax=Streptomyces sp. AC627_RSS907 TaxID=2823684 RepID=UPI001C241DC5|nr:hypothetical protein [Streptomyces sp. AC627_RSS907]